MEILGYHGISVADDPSSSPFGKEDIVIMTNIYFGKFKSVLFISDNGGGSGRPAFDHHGPDFAATVSLRWHYLHLLSFRFASSLPGGRMSFACRVSLSVALYPLCRSIRSLVVMRRR
jgi:hypothetical protein